MISKHYLFTSDRVFSDEFPKQYIINKERKLGEGAFGSVHLIIDKDHPEEEKFVAKTISIKENEQTFGISVS